MVLLIPLIASIPTVIGVSEAVASQRRVNDEKASGSTSTSAKDEKAQMRKFALECYCAGGKGRRAKEVHGGMVVLRGGKLWIQPPPKSNSKPTDNHHHPPPPPSPSSQPHLYPFRGFYIPYPDPARGNHPELGLVSFISDSPPTLNWVYVDRDTREVRYGNRTQSIKHVVGEWGWDLGEGDEEGEEGEGEGEEGGGVTLNGVEGAVVRFRKRDGEGEGGWEVLWEGEGEGEIGGAEKGGLTVSLERRWIDDGEGAGKGEGEKKEEKKGEEEEKGATLNVRTFAATATSKGKKLKGPNGGGGGGGN